MSNKIEKIIVKKLPIRLGQFLKLADIVQDGIEATMRIQNGEVLVNKEIETQRGRKLYSLDIITYKNKTWCITEVLPKA